MAEDQGQDDNQSNIGPSAKRLDDTLDDIASPESKSSPGTVVISIRIPVEMLDQIDAFQQQLQNTVGGGINITRVDAIRSLLSKALKEI